MGRISGFSWSMWARMRAWAELGLRILEIQRLLDVNAAMLFVARQQLAALQAGGALAGDEELAEEEDVVVSEEEG